MIRQLVTLCCLGAVSLKALHGQNLTDKPQPNRDLDVFCEELMTDFPYSTFTEAAEEGEQLYTTALKSEDCLGLAKGAALLFLAGSYGEIRPLTAVLLEQGQDLNCSIENGHIELWKGSLRFQQGSKEAALSCFQRAYEWLPEDSDQRYYALSNVAAVQQSLYLNHEAIKSFERLIEDFPKQAGVNDQHLINVAALQISIRELEAAHKSLMAVDTASISAEWKHLWSLNMLELSMSLNEDSTVDELWQQVAQVPIEEQSPDAWLILLSCALRVNDFNYFGRMMNFLSEENLPEDDVRLTMGLMPLLLMDPAESSLVDRWAVAKRISAYFHEVEYSIYSDLRLRINESVAERHSAVSELQAEHHAFRRKVLGGVLGTVIIFAGAFAVWIKRWRDKSSEIREEHSGVTLDDLRVIADSLSTGKDTSRALLHVRKLSRLAVPSGISSAWTQVALSPELKVLSEQELNVLMHIESGHSAKEIATLLDVSPGHVYNVRSSIRKKLDIDDSTSFTDWLNAVVKRGA